MKIRILTHPDISKARKDLTIGGEPYDRNVDEHVSEWAAAVALARYSIGEQVEESEFATQLVNAKTQQTLDEMVEEGTITMSWNGEQPVYSLTEKGKKKAEEIL